MIRYVYGGSILRTKTGLTPNQDKVVELLADGLSVKQIAAALHVSAATVGGHIVKIKKTLNEDTYVGVVNKWREMQGATE